MIELVWPAVVGVVALAAAFGFFVNVNATNRKLGRRDGEKDELKRQVEAAKAVIEAHSKPRPSRDQLRRVAERLSKIREEGDR